MSSSLSSVLFRLSSSAGLILLALFSSVPALAEEPSFFPELEGWKKGAEASWGPDNLYVPIDGAADLFLRYGFEQMRSMEYSDAKGNTVNVEAYRHATPLNAFGIYSQGRPFREKYLDIGVQAYAEPDSLNLLAGRHYIELRSSSDAAACQAAMRHIAEAMARALNAGAGLPTFFSLFPAKGRKACSEKYLTRDILGYAFLSNAYQVDYDVSGGTGSLFACVGDTEKEIEAMLASYLKQAKICAGTPEDSVMEAADKYHGKILLVKTGRHLLLASGSAASPEGKVLLEALRKGIEQTSKPPTPTL